MVVCVNMKKLTIGEAPRKRLNSQLIFFRLTKNGFRNPTSNLNLVISLSPITSNRLNKLSGCGLSIPLGPLALLYGQTDRRTDGRCYHKPIRHPRHSGPGRAGSSSMAKVSLSYTESNQPMWDFLKSARRRRRSVCVCVCVRCQWRSAGRYVASRRLHTLRFYCLQSQQTTAVRQPTLVRDSGLRLAPEHICSVEVRFTAFT